MVGCPNRASLCGAGATGVTALTSTSPVSVAVGAVALLLTDKCTWTITSYKYAPTFVVGADTTTFGITSPAW